MLVFLLAANDASGSGGTSLVFPGSASAFRIALTCCSVVVEIVPKTTALVLVHQKLSRNTAIALSSVALSLVIAAMVTVHARKQLSSPRPHLRNVLLIGTEIEHVV